MELSDLPIEVWEMIVENCDYISRVSLHSTSTLMHHLADTARLYIPQVHINEFRGGIKLCFKFETFRRFAWNYTDINENSTKITQFNKDDVYVDGKTSAELTAEMLGRVCFKKNVTIGYLSIRNVFDIETQLAAEVQKTFEKAGNHPLKIETIHWKRKGENTDLFDFFMNNCQPIALKHLMVVSRKPVDLFTKYRNLISSLKKLEVCGKLVATEDDILGLKARMLHLTSNSFTNNLVQKLVEKLIQEDVPGSCIVMKRREEGLTFENIPKQFDEIPSKVYRTVSSFAKYSAERQKRVIISTGTYGCSAAVQNYSGSEYDHMDLQMDCETECRDKCLQTLFSCNCYIPWICAEDDVANNFGYYDD